MGYSIRSFGGMLTDGVRNGPYLEAIQRYGGPGKRVLDLGCGTGFFTLAAARTGATVVAVELLDAVNVLPQVVQANGYSDRVQVYCGDVRSIDLEPFDLVISDLRGNVPLYGDNTDVLLHVHDHLLAAGGVLLPFRDEMRIALASLPEWFQRSLRPWQELDDHDWSAYQTLVLAEPTKLGEVDADALVSSEATLAILDYQDRESLTCRTHRFRGSLSPTASSQAHGILVWFDALITEDLGFSTRPGPSRPTYGRKLLPFQTPVPIERGRDVPVSVAAIRMKDEWQWQWQVGSGGEKQRQSSLDALPLVSGDLAAAYGASGGPDGPGSGVQRLL